jgi:hypothetical protein
VIDGCRQAEPALRTIVEDVEVPHAIRCIRDI